MSRLSASRVKSAWLKPQFFILLIVVVAFFLRFWRLDSVPPGWRDDELINSLVISQKVIDGQWAVYYPDASGHEALYHILSAGTLALFGPGVPGIRWLPALLGTLTVLLTYLLADRLFGRWVGLLSAATLAFSFWSLMYSRIGIRHIALPVLLLAAFYAFWRGLEKGENEPEQSSTAASFLWAGFFMGLGFYTYFASRGMPLILLVLCLYLWLFHRPMLRRHIRGLLLMFGLATIMALPLAFTLLGQPDSEARVEELAVPIVEARAGNLDPLAEHVVRTLSMFHADGDDEWLYNIPFRPIFGPIGAAFFWSGVAFALWYSLKPLFRFLHSRLNRSAPAYLRSSHVHLEAAGAFLLIWWLVGISPGFISVPAASLGHTIVAQPAVYILAALPILPMTQLLNNRFPERRSRTVWLSWLLAVILLASVAFRDLPDYFQEWPSRGMTRFLYRADLKNLAHYLNDHGAPIDFGVTGLLAGPWDKIALEIDLAEDTAVRPRWYNPERAVLLRTDGQPSLTFSGFPLVPTLYQSLYERIRGETAGGYGLARVNPISEPVGTPTCFQNGLCLLAADYDPQGQTLDLIWEVGATFRPPFSPLISNPPPPGIYSGPRLLIFSQMLDASGDFLVGDDGLWVDSSTLQPGDRFLQQHRLPVNAGSSPAKAIFGLYDPMTGERILTEDGRDHAWLDVANPPR